MFNLIAIYRFWWLCRLGGLMRRVAIFVDVQNICYTTRQGFNRNFNYNSFWTQVTSGREIVAAIAYAIDRGNEKQRQFQNILRVIGFEVKLKPFIQRNDGSAKGDWDVGITLDVMEYAPQSDVVVLASGDGDFDLLLNKIQMDYDVLAEVYGVRQLTVQSPINSATTFIAITDDFLL